MKAVCKTLVQVNRKDNQTLRYSLEHRCAKKTVLCPSMHFNDDFALILSDSASWLRHRVELIVWFKKLAENQLSNVVDEEEELRKFYSSR